MKRVAMLVAAMLILALPMFAGDAWDEYGDPSEMKGLKRIYVDTGEDLDVRKLIIEELKIEIPDISITAGPDGAELALIYVPRLVKGDDTKTTLYVLPQSKRRSA